MAPFEVETTTLIRSGEFLLGAKWGRTWNRKPNERAALAGMEVPQAEFKGGRNVSYLSAVVGAGEGGGHARGHPPRPRAGAAERPRILLLPFHLGSPARGDGDRWRRRRGRGGKGTGVKGRLGPSSSPLDAHASGGSSWVGPRLGPVAFTRLGPVNLVDSKVFFYFLA